MKLLCKWYEKMRKIILRKLKRINILINKIIYLIIYDRRLGLNVCNVNEKYLG